MRRSVFIFAAFCLVAEATARIKLENNVDACACWIAEYVSLEGISVSGDLHLAFELGAITLSSGTLLRVQLRHASASGQNDAGSRWIVPQLTNCLMRDAAGNLAWLSPKGVPIVLGAPLSGIFTSSPGTEIKARTAGDGRIEIRCPHGFTYRYRGYSLDEIEAVTGEVFRANTRGGLIEELTRLDRSGEREIVLAANYDEYSRLTGLTIQGRRHRFEYASGSRRLVKWRYEGRQPLELTTFRYDRAGLVSCISGSIDREFAWGKNPFVDTGIGLGGARMYKIEEDGDLRYEYSVERKIVTLTAIRVSGRRQRLYYNLDTGNMDLFDP